MAIIKKQSRPSTGKDFEKLKLSYIADRNIKWYHLGKQLIASCEGKYNLTLHN